MKFFKNDISNGLKGLFVEFKQHFFDKNFTK